MVEGLYESSVDVTFNIPFQSGWRTIDPYNGCETADDKSGCVIGKFKDYWNANRPPATFDGRNSALLFTNKSIVNVNLAYPTTVCLSPDFAYAMLVGNFSTAGYGNYRYAAAAHEISHLFSAQHITGRNLILNPDCYNSIQEPEDPNRPFYGQLRMCQFTINEVTTHIQQNDCLLTE